MQSNTELTFFSDFLIEVNIFRMNSSSRSPDLIPIEHVWNGLTKAIAQRDSLPKTHKELKNALIKEWILLTQTFINTFINSMRACNEVSGPVQAGHIVFQTNVSRDKCFISYF